MDRIFIQELRVEAVIGIYDWERQVRQPIVIDLEMACDCAAAARTDSVDDAVNYKSVAKRIIQFVGDSQFFLVETLAESIARIVREEFAVPWVRLRLNKEGALRGARGVGVIIERGEAS